MKLFLTRDTDGESARFAVLDEYGKEKYIVTGKSGNSKHTMYLSDINGNRLSVITLYDFVAKYFSVKCNKRLYALVPYIKEQFAFIIYGSTFRFMGDISVGRFSLIDVDQSPVMTQKKCWGKNGDGFEINIFSQEYEIFAVSSAVCAAMYILANGESPIPI